jgi:hypothetical protein
MKNPPIEYAVMGSEITKNEFFIIRADLDHVDSGNLNAERRGKFEPSPKRWGCDPGLPRPGLRNSTRSAGG